jgi:hypothetical protein
MRLYCPWRRDVTNVLPAVSVYDNLIRGNYKYCGKLRLPSFKFSMHIPLYCRFDYRNKTGRGQIFQDSAGFHRALFKNVPFGIA